MVNTMTFEIVARATILLSESLWFGYCEIMLRGSKVQTSPLLPENMQRESYPRMPNVLLKDSSNTDPPESHINARL